MATGRVHVQLSRNYGTGIAWAGQMAERGSYPRIEAKFLHKSDVKEENEAEFSWAATRIGSDIFVKQ